MRRFLIAQSELPDERAARRRRAGKSSGETYKATLAQLCPGAAVDIISPADADGERPGADAIARYDAVFLTGSPMHVYDATPEVERQLGFMRDVFASGTPSFGSCAGCRSRWRRRVDGCARCPSGWRRGLRGGSWRRTQGASTRC